MTKNNSMPETTSSADSEPCDKPMRWTPPVRWSDAWVIATIERVLLGALKWGFKPRYTATDLRAGTGTSHASWRNLASWMSWKTCRRVGIAIGGALALALPVLVFVAPASYVQAALWGFIGDVGVVALATSKHSQAKTLAAPAKLPLVRLLKGGEPLD